MTDSTQPAPDPSITAPSAQDVQTGAAAPEADKPAKAPRKRAASKTAAAKTPEAPAPVEGDQKGQRSLYLPALPDGFEYTGVTATGPGGETINIAPAAGADQPAGSAALSFEGAGLKRDQTFADMQSALRGGAKAAKAMADVAKREAELARIREEAFDL